MDCTVSWKDRKQYLVISSIVINGSIFIQLYSDNHDVKMSSEQTVDAESTVYSSERQGPPDLRILHYNDVYHIEFESLPKPRILTHTNNYPEQGPLSPLEGSHASKPRSMNIVQSRSTPDSPLCSPFSRAMPSIQVWKALLQREGTWFPS